MEYRLECRWAYEKGAWELFLYCGEKCCPLESVSDIGKYVSPLPAGGIPGLVRMQSKPLPEGTYDVELPAAAAFEEDKQIWSITADSTAAALPCFKDAVKLALQVSKASFPAELLPDWGLARISGRYQTQTEDLVGGLSVALTADGVWNLFGGFALGHPGLQVYAQGEYGALSVLGSVIIGGKELGFSLGYGSKLLYVSARSTPAELPSLVEFGAALGLPVEEWFPKEMQNLGSVQMEKLNLVLPCTLNSLERVEFSITMARPIVLFGIESLTLSEIGMDFDGRRIGQSGEAMIFRLRGALSFEQEKLQLEAFRYGTGTNWLFTGCIYNGNEYGLMSLWRLLSASDPPEVLEGILVPIFVIEASYDMGRCTFSLKASFVNGNEARLSVDGSRTPSGCQVDISLAPAFSLSSLPVVGDKLHALDGVSLNAVALRYETGVGVTLAGTLHVLEWEFPFSLLVFQEAAPEGGTERRTSEARAGEIMWLNTGLTFGPVSLPRLGIGYREGKIQFGVDVSVCCGGLTIHFQQLVLKIDTADFQYPAVSLEGMALSLVTASFSIGGSLKRVSETPREYEGSLLFAAGDWKLTAIGSYSEAEEHPSIFAYGVLRTRLMGPPAFTVTGLAAGFGYQASLILPEVEQVEAFPLVRMALEQGSEEELLRLLKEQYVREETGCMWLAAGVCFTSFQMVESFALLTVAFGKRLEVALLGLGTLSHGSIAKATLCLKAEFCPDEGVFSLMAVLTKDSYILSEQCRLTGGFALYVWYGGIHKGDFVLSLGGYHDSFRRPAHYPVVDRLGFSWIIDQHLTFSGGIYFAVTPACIMAGGNIDARYENGNLRAWFYARADFLMYWKPFYYQLELSVGLGASYRVDCLFVHHTFTVELAASLRLWGPEFSGLAKITWWIISFTIRFGNGSDKIQYLTWEDFLAQCVQSGQTAGISGRAEGRGYATAYVADGLIGDVKDEKGETVSLVRGEALKLSIHTQIPNQAFRVGETKLTRKENRELYVLPMGGCPLACEAIVTVEKQTGAERWVSVREDTFVVAEQCENLPGALWGKELSEAAPLVEGALTGLLIEPKEITYYRFPPTEPVDFDRIAGAEAVKREWTVREAQWMVQEEDKGETNREFSNVAMSAESVRDRQDLFAWFSSLGFELEASGEIGGLAGDAENLFTEQIGFCHDYKVKEGKPF